MCTSRCTTCVTLYPLARIIFLFPFPAPAPATGGAPGAPSCALIPALIVSISTPVGSSGEYGDTRLASGGSGAGGWGSFASLVDDATAAEDFASALAGCFSLPFGVDCVGFEGSAGGVLADAEVVKGGRGTSSGFTDWM